MSSLFFEFAYNLQIPYFLATRKYNIRFNRATVTTCKHQSNVDSDIYTDPQALMLAPESVIAISKEIVASTNHVEAGCRAARRAIELIRDAKASGQLLLNERETDYLDQIADEIETIPLDESAFIDDMLPTIDTEKCILKEYGIEA
jgi:hypothetical protein